MSAAYGFSGRGVKRKVGLIGFDHRTETETLARPYAYVTG